jgi:hypothetical protein
MISAALAALANVDALVVSKAAAARFRSEVDIRRSPQDWVCIGTAHGSVPQFAVCPTLTKRGRPVRDSPLRRLGYVREAGEGER